MAGSDEVDPADLCLDRIVSRAPRSGQIFSADMPSPTFPAMSLQRQHIPVTETGCPRSRGIAGTHSQGRKP